MSDITERLGFASDMAELEKAAADAIDEIARLRGLLREWVDSPCQPIAVDILRRTQEALDHD